MKINLFTKIFGVCLVIIILLSVLIPLLTFGSIKRQYVSVFSDNLKNLAVTLRPEIAAFFETRRYQELDNYVKTLKYQLHSRITVIDREGKVIADSEKNPANMENHKIRPEVSEALSGDIGKSLRFSVTVEEDMLYVAIPIEKNGKKLGVLRVSALLRQINSLLNELKMHIFWIALIVTILSVLIAFALSRGISTSVRKLVKAVKRISQRDFEAKVFLKNEDELKELGDSINNMGEQMRELFADISGRNEELDTIISSIQEPLVVLDKDGRIRLSNESFNRLVRSSEAKGKFHWEAVRSPDFIELIKKANAERIYFADEVRINDRTFLGSVNFLISRDETVVVLHDITEFKKLEEIKKDFIANLSHEIRTPLTAIKGFVETLEDEEDIKSRHYLDIIKRHTERLMNIVRDLLLLSELEEKGEVLNYEYVSIGNIVENMLKIFENKAKEKGLKITLNIPDTTPGINADPFKIEQIFINLLDNAIKYTESGEITISLTNDDASIKIEIADTGIGIQKEHMPRIFERFYVVDKSRSKKLGGTGLGLSIVKHIVNLHKGKIDVESAPGKGTKFIVTLPINSASSAK